MLTPKQAAILLFVDPTFKPGPMVLGSMRLAGFTDDQDKLKPIARDMIAAEIRASSEGASSRPDCELHDIPIEGCCC